MTVELAYHGSPATVTPTAGRELATAAHAFTLLERQSVMRKILTAGLIILASAAFSQVAAQGTAPKALQDAVAARSKAQGSADGAGWGKYTTEDFMVIGADGSVRTKAERIAEINKSTPTTPGGDAPDRKWRMYGAGTAVSTQQAPVAGKPTMITTVWVVQQGTWKVASAQLTTVTK